jgi:tyrosinase
MLIWRISLWAALSSLSTTVTAYTPASTIETDALAVLGLLKLGLYEAQNEVGKEGSTCNLGNVALRKEW